MTVVSIIQDVRGGGGNRTIVSWYRQWALEHLVNSVECFLDESTAGWPLRARQHWGPHETAVARALPSLHVPPYLVGRPYLRKLWDDVDEVHVVGAVALQGWLAPRDVPTVVWLATTIEDERRSSMYLKGWRRRLLYTSTLRPLRAIERDVLARATKVVATSPHTADVLMRHGLPSSKVQVRAVPIEVDHFQASPAGNREGLLFVGRVRDPRKGFDRIVRMLEASELVSATGVDVVSQEAPDSKVVSNVSHSLRWHGLVDDLAAVYQGAKLLLMPSRQEGLGIVAFEALSCATPVVAYRCGGADEYLAESDGATLVENDSEFLNAVQRLLGDPAARTEMGARGREWVSQHMNSKSFLRDPTIFRP